MVEPNQPGFDDEDIDLEDFIAKTEPLIQDIQLIFTNYDTICQKFTDIQERNQELRSKLVDFTTQEKEEFNIQERQVADVGSFLDGFEQ